MNSDVFISYAKPDADAAHRLAKTLKQSALKVWIDTECLLPGQRVNTTIRRAIRDSRYFISLLSSSSVNPGTTIQQLNWALDVSEKYPESDIHIIPVRLDDCTAPSEKVQQLSMVDLFPEWDAGIETILRAIHGDAENSNAAPSEAGFRGENVEHKPIDPSGITPIKNRWALLVGINRYTDAGFASLRYCVNDVTDLDKILKRAGYETVLMHDDVPEDFRKPTRDNIEEELTKICTIAEKDDLLLVYFACHGMLAEGQPVLIASDTRMGLIGKRGLHLSEVERIMKTSASRRLVLMLDACHTGSEIAIRGLSDPDFIRNVHDRAMGFAVLAASTSQQFAQEWKEKEHGVFSCYLLEGLAGAADRGAKGFVTVDDIKNHVLHGLRQWIVRNGGFIQEPTARIDTMGDMILVDYREGRSDMVQVTK